jgi:hypothetical protein
MEAFRNIGLPPNHPVVMDDHDVVLKKPMVTTAGPPFWERPTCFPKKYHVDPHIRVS